MITMRIKNISVVILSALACISCDKEILPQVSDGAIDFDVKASNIKVVETRSTLLYNTLPENSSFGVVGYCVPYVLGSTTLNYSGASGLWSSKVQNSHPDIFYNQKVDYANGTCTYDSNSGVSGNQVKGWVTPPSGDNSDPSKYTYTFFAYYPYQSGSNNSSGWSVTSGSSALGAPTLRFIMPFTSSSASTRLDDSLIPDAMVASTYDRLRADGAVPVTFAHILTGVNIKVANFDDRQISINSITLSGTFNKQVTFNFNNNAAQYTGTYSGTFSFTESGSTYTADAGASINLNNGKSILLLSNLDSKLGNNIKLNISYSVGGINAPDVVIDIPTEFKFAQGTNYTFTLNFVNGAITLLTESELQWEDGGDSNSTIK